MPSHNRSTRSQTRKSLGANATADTIDSAQEVKETDKSQEDKSSDTGSTVRPATALGVSTARETEQNDQPNHSVESVNTDGQDIEQAGGESILVDPRSRSELGLNPNMSFARNKEQEDLAYALIETAVEEDYKLPIELFHSFVDLVSFLPLDMLPDGDPWLDQDAVISQKGGIQTVSDFFQFDCAPDQPLIPRLHAKVHKFLPDWHIMKHEEVRDLNRGLMRLMFDQYQQNMRDKIQQLAESGTDLTTYRSFLWKYNKKTRKSVRVPTPPPPAATSVEAVRAEGEADEVPPPLPPRPLVQLAGSEQIRQEPLMDLSSLPPPLSPIVETSRERASTDQTKTSTPHPTPEETALLQTRGETAANDEPNALHYARNTDQWLDGIQNRMSNMAMVARDLAEVSPRALQLRAQLIADQQRLINELDPLRRINQGSPSLIHLEDDTTELPNNRQHRSGDNPKTERSSTRNTDHPPQGDVRQSRQRERAAAGQEAAHQQQTRPAQQQQRQPQQQQQREPARPPPIEPQVRIAGGGRPPGGDSSDSSSDSDRRDRRRPDKDADHHDTRRKKTKKSSRSSSSSTSHSQSNLREERDIAKDPYVKGIQKDLDDALANIEFLKSVRDQENERFQSIVAATKRIEPATQLSSAIPPRDMFGTGLTSEKLELVNRRGLTSTDSTVKVEPNSDQTKVQKSDLTKAEQIQSDKNVQDAAAKIKVANYATRQQADDAAWASKPSAQPFVPPFSLYGPKPVTGVQGYTYDQNGLVTPQIAGHPHPAQATLSQAAALRLVKYENRHWNPYRQFYPHLFTRDRQAASKLPRQDYMSATGIPSTVKMSEALVKPKPFAKDTPTRTYAKFLSDLMLYMMGLDIHPVMWIGMFSSFLEGDASRIFDTIQSLHAFMFFQDVAIELGNRLCPIQNETTLILKLQEVYWDCTRSGLGKLVQEILSLMRDLHPGQEHGMIVQSEAARKFLQAMPPRWQKKIRKTCAWELIDDYLSVATQLCDEEEAHDRIMETYAVQRTRSSAASSETKFDPQFGTVKRASKEKTTTSQTTRQQQPFQAARGRSLFRGATRSTTQAPRTSSATPASATTQSVAAVPASTAFTPRYPADSPASGGQRPSRQAVKVTAGGRQAFQQTAQGESRPKTCYFCGDPNHLQRDCPKRKIQLAAMISPELVKVVEACEQASGIHYEDVLEDAEGEYFEGEGEAEQAEPEPDENHSEGEEQQDEVDHEPIVHTNAMVRLSDPIVLNSEPIEVEGHIDTGAPLPIITEGSNRCTDSIVPSSESIVFEGHLDTGAPLNFITERDNRCTESHKHDIDVVQLSINAVQYLPTLALGPVLHVPTIIEGQPFDGFFDTGCPICIMSGQAINRIACSTPNPDRVFWSRLKKLPLAEHFFEDYHGKRLALTSYIETQVTIGDVQFPVIFLIDPESKHDVLLGTPIMNQTDTCIMMKRPGIQWSFMPNGNVVHPAPVTHEAVAKQKWYSDRLIKAHGKSQLLVDPPPACRLGSKAKGQQTESSDSSPTKTPRSQPANKRKGKSDVTRKPRPIPTPKVPKGKATESVGKDAQTDSTDTATQQNVALRSKSTPPTPKSTRQVSKRKTLYARLPEDPPVSTGRNGPGGVDKPLQSLLQKIEKNNTDKIRKNQEKLAEMYPLPKLADSSTDYTPLRQTTGTQPTSAPAGTSDSLGSARATPGQASREPQSSSPPHDGMLTRAQKLKREQEHAKSQLHKHQVSKIGETIWYDHDVMPITSPHSEIVKPRPITPKDLLPSPRPPIRNAKVQPSWQMGLEEPTWEHGSVQETVMNVMRQFPPIHHIVARVDWEGAPILYPEKITPDQCKAGDVYTTRFTYVPPYGTAQIKVHAKDLLDGQDYIFERTEDALKEIPVAVPPVVQTANSKGYVMVVHNNEPFPISIPKGLKAATASQCEVVDVDNSAGDISIIHWVTPEEIAEHWDRIEPQIKFGEQEDDHAEARKRCLLILRKHHACFADSLEELGEANDAEFSFELLEIPPKCAPRRLPQPLQEPIYSLLFKNVDTGIMRHSDGSRFASPIVPVRKKNGEIRIASDFRLLNARTKLTATPLPRIDDIYNAIGAVKPKYFIALDLASGYHQIRMSKEAQEMSAVVCGPYHLEWVRMPFGLSSSPGWFMNYMQRTMRGVDDERVFVFLDDIIIVGETIDVLLDVLDKVLKRLEDKCLRLKPSKCEFLCQSVTFLGLVLDKYGLRTDPKKIDAIMSRAEPKNPHEVRQFLGMAGYFRKFIPNYATIAKPLTTLLEKDADLTWTNECQLAFTTLQERLTSAPVLVWPDFSKPFFIETDASNVGIGAQLLQRAGDDDWDIEENLALDVTTPLLKQADFHPIAFISKALNKHERNYGASEKEALGVVYACRQFEAYVYRRPVYVITDCRALQYMLKSKELTGKLARWALAIQALNPIIIYRQGRINEMADGLSRNAFSKYEIMAAENQPIDDDEDPWDMDSSQVTTQLSTVAIVSTDSSPEWWQTDPTVKAVQDAQRADKYCLAIYDLLENGKLPTDPLIQKMAREAHTMYTVVYGIVWRDSDHQHPEPRVLVPEVEVPGILREMHDCPFSGHPGPKRTWQRTAMRYFWPTMKKDVYRYVQKCLTCAQRRGQQERVHVPQSHVPVACRPMHTVAIDVHHVGTASSGNKYTILAYDLFTKDVMGTAVKDQKASTLAYALVNDVFCQYGPPTVILSDRGPNLMSAIFKEMCNFFGVRRLYTTAYNPKCNGAIEKFHHTLDSLLSAIARDTPEEWDRYLQMALYAYRTTPHSATGFPPMALTFARLPVIPSDTPLAAVSLDEPSTPLEYFDQAQDVFRECYKRAGMNISKAQATAKRIHDQKVKEVDWKVGDLVWWYNQRVKRGNLYKLARPYSGPMEIIDIQESTAVLKYADGSKRTDIERVHLDKLSRAYLCFQNEVTTVSYVRHNIVGCVTKGYGGLPSNAHKVSQVQKVIISRELVRKPNFTSKFWTALVKNHTPL